MNRLQVIVLGVSVVAFGGAYFVFNNYLGSRKGPVIVQAAPNIDTTSILVATQDIAMGSSLNDQLVHWQDWPKNSVSELMIDRTAAPDLQAFLKDYKNRDSFLRGEPIRRDKLVKAGDGGYIAAVLESGMRAVAIKIDQTGDSSAGGFILPHDRVDVVRVFRDEESTRVKGSEVLAHQTVLSNVRVLAIGQASEEQNGKKVITGSNATLELSPAQAEIVLHAQNLPSSHLNLVLRSLADSAGAPETVNDPSESQTNALIVVRYGTAQQSSR